MFPSRLRWPVTIFILTLLSLPSVFAADPPKITLAPQWRPGTTLDSIDTVTPNALNAGDDFRYVDVDVYVTTTVQFWSVQLVCTASPTLLTSYDDANSMMAYPNGVGDGDPNNFVEPVVWGPAWGTLNQGYTALVEPYNPTTGARTMTATALGNRYPMGGRNGVTDTFLIATLRYRAKDVAANGSAIFTCTSTFLNRNGTPVLAATYTPPPPLPVITGYTISGMAQYQGRTSHAGITVSCDYNGDGPSLQDFSVLTTATGAFSYISRTQGYYTCSFYGDTVSPFTLGYKPDRYLSAQTALEVYSSYQILPVVLMGGNVNPTTNTDNNPNTIDEVVDLADIVTITSGVNWNKTSAGGDVNGDGKTNQADLTIAGTNFEFREQLEARHVIYNMPRDYDQWQHSRVWLGGPFSGTTNSMLATPAGDIRDLWATLSPDGKQLAFVRDTPPNGMALFTAPVVNGVAGTPTRITPVGAWYFPLAPSWSPDGTRIAFVCSWYEDGSTNGGVASGYLADVGDLCVIDATGRNFRQFATINNPNYHDIKSRIYPPAWLSDTELVYGGSSQTTGSGAMMNTLCPNTLCYLDIQHNIGRVFDTDVTAGGLSSWRRQDMPVVRQGVLFYRFYDSFDGSRRIRWAILNYGDLSDPIGTISLRNNVTYPMHMYVDYDSVGDSQPASYIPISTDVDYYNVSTVGGNIIFYPPDSYEFHKAYQWEHPYGGTPAVWGNPFSHYLDDIVPNPYGGDDHTPYDGDDEEDGSQVYAHRNTAEWLP